LDPHCSGRGLLWVCEVDLRAGPRSRVVALQIADGRRVREVAFDGPAHCNDLVTDDAGIVYATDSAQPRIVRVDAEGLTVFAEDPRFAPASERALGRTGLDLSPDGESLLVAKLAPPTLFRVGVDDPADIAAVQFTGDAFGVPGDPRFPGPDGVAFVGDALHVAHDAGVQQLRLAGDGFKRAEVRTTAALQVGLTCLVDAGGAALRRRQRRLPGPSRPQAGRAAVRGGAVDLGRFDGP
jgi:hypothetical protein